MFHYGVDFIDNKLIVIGRGTFPDGPEAKKRRRKMKKSLLCWGALIVIALCFVGCCYYNTTHCHPCKKHCGHTPCCNEQGKKCPANNQNQQNDGTVETMTVEEVEIIPVQNNAAPAGKSAAPQAPAATAPAHNTAPAGN